MLGLLQSYRDELFRAFFLLGLPPVVAALGWFALDAMFPKGGRR